MKTEEILRAIVKLEEKLAERGTQKLEAVGHGLRGYSVDKVEFEEWGVTVQFKETYRDADYDVTSLNIEEIDMDDEKWVAHIESLNAVRLEKEQAKKDKEIEYKLVQKKREIERLQEEIIFLENKKDSSQN